MESSYPLFESQGLEIENESFELLNSLPVATIISDLNSKILFANSLAIEFLGYNLFESHIKKPSFNDFIIESNRENNIIEYCVNSSKPTERKVLIRRSDNSIACINLFAGLYLKNGNKIIIHFTPISLKSQYFISEILSGIKHEMILLKPYLNKPGRELLETILRAKKLENLINFDSTDDIHSAGSNQALKRKISGVFPELTNSELNLCTLLSLQLNIEEIALITGKTSNSLRVLFHRLVRKTNLSGSELLRKLETLS